ncbi:Tyrosine-protein phosphatase non-receptor type 9 [Dirofilaria immitis]|nr:Tyrosine-protein phosphatase non-receptor type 9 [Dirofilaria immitis]
MSRRGFWRERRAEGYEFASGISRRIQLMISSIRNDATLQLDSCQRCNRTCCLFTSGVVDSLKYLRREVVVIVLMTGMVMTNNVDLSKMDKMAQDAYNLSEAYRFKEQANARYSEKDYAAAIYLYHQCLLRARAIQQLSQFGLQSLARMERNESIGDQEESSKVVDANDVTSQSAAQKNQFNKSREEMKIEATDIALKCYSNLAACILKGQNRTEPDFLRAVEYCDKVLSVQPSNEKALYRKGLALSKINMYEKAIAVLQKCSNRGAQVIINECQQLLAEERRRRDDQIRRNFSRAFGARINGQHLLQEFNVGVANQEFNVGVANQDGETQKIQESEFVCNILEALEIFVTGSESLEEEEQKESTVEEALVTMATVEDDEGVVVSARPKKKSGPDQALEKFALATVAKIQKIPLLQEIEGLKAEFATLKTFMPTLNSQAAFDRNKDCNRYNNIICYDHTRIQCASDRDYIHANYVRTSLCNLPNNYICTQGPMDSTVNDFWRLVWQEKPKTIVMLCKVIECGKQKCSQYFPLNQGETKQYGKVIVQNVRKTSSDSNERLRKGNPSFVLTLFKWLDWPDFGVPTSGMGMLRILRQIRDQPRSTAIIHCSAGVGRSGTIIACFGCDKEIRTQRAGAVQTEGQYIYLHRTLCEFESSGGRINYFGSIICELLRSINNTVSAQFLIIIIRDCIMPLLQSVFLRFEEDMVCGCIEPVC